MERKSLNWGWIIFLVVVFWPVGAYFLFKKLAVDKSAIMNEKTNRLPIIAWVLIAIGVIGFFGTVSSPGEGAVGGIIVELAMIVGGVLLLLKMRNAKKMAAKYKKYIEIVVNQNLQSIDSISSAVGLSYDFVTKDLQDMIDKEYLKSAYINLGNREIVLKRREPMSPQQETTAGQSSSQSKVVQCRGCGANNVVAVGRISECEYCGTAIEA